MSGEASASHSLADLVLTALAVTVMATYFAMTHWGNPNITGGTRIWAMINIALAGVLFGVCYLKTRSLALPIGLHLGWNWAQGCLLGFGVSGHTDKPGLLKPVFHDKPLWISGGDFGLEASVLFTLICSAAIVAMLFWKPKRT